MNRTDFAARTRDYVTDYIKFADAKAGAILAIALAVSAVLGSLADRMATVLTGVPGYVSVPAAAVGLSLVASTVMIVSHVVEALSPTITAAGKSLASFPDIAADRTGYLDRCGTLVEHEIAVEFEQHAAHLSAIASRKFSDVARAVWWLRIQVLGTYALVVLYVVLRVNQ